MLTTLAGGVKITSQALGDFEYSSMNANGTSKDLKVVLDDLREAFKSMTDQEKVSNAENIASKTGMAGLLAIVGESEESYNSLATSIANSDGRAEDMANTMKDNLTGDLKIAQSAVSALGTTIGETLEPTARGIVQSFTGVIDTFAKMDEGTKKLIIGVTATGVAFGALVLATGLISKASGLAVLGFGTLKTGLGKVSIGVGKMATKLGVSKMALMGATGGALALVAGLIGIVMHVKNAEKKLLEFNKATIDSINQSDEKIKQNTSSLKSNQEAFAEIEELQNKINSTSNTAERTALEGELINKKQALIDLMPEVAEGMDAETTSQQQLNEKLQEYMDLKERENEIEARKMASEAREFIKENKITGSSASGTLNSSLKAEKDIEYLTGQLENLADLEEDAIITIENGTQKSVGDHKKFLEQRLGDSEAYFEKQYTLSQQTYDAYSALDPKALTKDQKEYMDNFENMELIASELDGTLHKMGEYEFSVEGVKSSEESIKKLNEEVASSEEIFKHLPGSVKKSVDNLLEDVNNQNMTVKDFTDSMFEFEIASKKAYGENSKAAKTSMNLLLKAFSNGELSVEQFEESMKSMGGLTELNFKNLSKEGQKSLLTLVKRLNEGKIEVKDFGKSINLASKVGGMSLRSLSKDTKTSINKFIKDFSNGKVSIEDFEKASNALGLYTSKDFSKLDKASQKTMDNLVANLPKGGNAAQELENAINGMSVRASIDMSKVDENTKKVINSIVSKFNAGEMSSENFANAMNLMSIISSTGLENINEKSQTAINNLMGKFTSGEISANDFAAGLMNALGMAETNLSSFSAEGQSQILGLIGKFLSGEIAAEELQSQIDLLKTNPEFATNIGKTMDSVTTSSGTAKGAVDGVKTSMNGVNNKTVTLTVNKVETTTKKTVVQNAATAGTGSSRPWSLENNVTSTPNTPNSKSNKSAILSSKSSPESGSEPHSKNGKSSGLGENSSNAPVSSGNIASTPQNPNLRKSDAQEEAERKAEEAARKHEQMEQDAINKIQELRDKLAEALVKKAEEQRDKELKILDEKLEAIEKNYDEQKELLDKSTQDKIQALEDERDALNGDRTEDYQGTVNAIKAELDMWKGNDSAYAKGKVKELEEKLKEAEKELKNKQIDDEIEALEKEQEEKEKALDEQYNSQVEAIEKEKIAKEAYWEKQLSDQVIYAEANKLLLSKNMTEMTELIKTYVPEWDSMGLLFGESLVDGIKRAIKDGLNAKDFMAGVNGSYEETENPWESSKNPSSGNNSSSSSSNNDTSKGKKGKVVKTNALNVRSGAGTSHKKIGTVWRDEEVSILAEKNGWYQIEYFIDGTNKKKKGWSSGNYIQKFHTGGIIGKMTSDEGIAMVQSGERVLSREQTGDFENLVTWLPNLEDIVSKFNNIKANNVSNDNSNQSTHISNTFNVYPTKDTDTDKLVDNVIKGIENKARRSGVNLKQNRIFVK